MASKVTTLYEDSAKTNALYPRTKTSAVSDNDGNALGNIAVYNAETVVGGANPIQIGIDMDLLWTNASPTSDFSAQTVSLDLSGYSMLLIKTKPYTTYTGDLTINNILRVGDTVPLIGDSLCVGTAERRARKATSSVSGVTFGSGEFYTGYQSSATIQNVQCTPLYIYGIR